MTPSLTAGLTALVNKYFERFEPGGWNRCTDFDWSAIEADKLTDLQIDAVRTAHMIEDHIPSYTAEYVRLFPLSPDLDPDTAAYRRQMLRFVSRWTSDEDRHAHTLENYLRACPRVDTADVEREILATVVRPYKAPSDNPLGLAVYTAVQEKATQLFYGCLGAAVEEPVLKRVMDELNADEAKHCGFFVDLLKLHLEHAEAGDMEKIKAAVDGFGMPLADIVDDYRRRSIRMMRAAPGYDFRAGFAVLERALRGCAAAKEASPSRTLRGLLTTLEGLRPAAATAVRSPVAAA